MHKHIKKFFVIVFIIILSIGVAGGILSLKFDNSHLGDAATWFSGCASASALFFAYMQIDNANETLKEMKKERELSYLPELVSVSKTKTIDLKITSKIVENQMAKVTSEITKKQRDRDDEIKKFSFKIKNIGMQAALDVSITYFIDDNDKDIKDFLAKHAPKEVFDKYKSIDGEEVEYYNKNWDLRTISPWSNDVISEVKPFLKKEKTCKIEIPSSYLLMVRDYFEEMDYAHDNNFTVTLNPFPRLIMQLNYKNLIGKQYTKKLVATIDYAGYSSENNEFYPKVYFRVFN